MQASLWVRTTRCSQCIRSPLELARTLSAKSRTQDTHQSASFGLATNLFSHQFPFPCFVQLTLVVRVMNQHPVIFNVNLRLAPACDVQLVLERVFDGNHMRY